MDPLRVAFFNADAFLELSALVFARPFPDLGIVFLALGSEFEAAAAS